MSLFLIGAVCGVVAGAPLGAWACTYRLVCREDAMEPQQGGAA